MIAKDKICMSGDNILFTFILKITFLFLYPIYLLKFWREKIYIEERLRKAGLLKIRSGLFGSNAKQKRSNATQNCGSNAAKIQCKNSVRKITVREVYKNLFLNGIDSWRFLKSAGIIPQPEFENLELVKEALNGENAVVFASIHLGAFEMLHRCLPRVCLAHANGKQPDYIRNKFCEAKKINLVTASFRRKKLDAYLTKLRSAENIKVVKDIEISQTLKTIIRNKEILAVMADQAKGKGENFHILGQDVPFFLKLPITASKLGAIVIFFRTFRKNGKHIVRFEKICAPHFFEDIKSSSSREREVQGGITKEKLPCKKEIAKMFESWILEYPEQWAWNYSKR